jgi:hypothetical protein
LLADCHQKVIALLFQIAKNYYYNFQVDIFEQAFRSILFYIDNLPDKLNPLVLQVLLEYYTLGGKMGLKSNLPSLVAKLPHFELEAWFRPTVLLDKEINKKNFIYNFLLYSKQPDLESIILLMYVNVLTFQQAFFVPFFELLLDNGYKNIQRYAVKCVSIEHEHRLIAKFRTMEAKGNKIGLNLETSLGYLLELVDLKSQSLENLSKNSDKFISQTSRAASSNQYPLGLVLMNLFKAVYFYGSRDDLLGLLSSALSYLLLTFKNAVENKYKINYLEILSFKEIVELIKLKGFEKDLSLMPLNILPLSSLLENIFSWRIYRELITSKLKEEFRETVEKEIEPKMEPYTCNIENLRSEFKQSWSAYSNLVSKIISTSETSNKVVIENFSINSVFHSKSAVSSLKERLYTNRISNAGCLEIKSNSETLLEDLVLKIQKFFLERPISLEKFSSHIWWKQVHKTLVLCLTSMQEAEKRIFRDYFVSSKLEELDANRYRKLISYMEIESVQQGHPDASVGSTEFKRLSNEVKDLSSSSGRTL